MIEGADAGKRFAPATSLIWTWAAFPASSNDLEFAFREGRSWGRIEVASYRVAWRFPVMARCWLRRRARQWPLSVGADFGL